MDKIQTEALFDLNKNNPRHEHGMYEAFEVIIYSFHPPFTRGFFSGFVKKKKMQQSVVE